MHWMRLKAPSMGLGQALRHKGLAYPRYVLQQDVSSGYQSQQNETYGLLRHHHGAGDVAHQGIDPLLKPPVSLAVQACGGLAVGCGYSCHRLLESPGGGNSIRNVSIQSILR